MQRCSHHWLAPVKFLTTAFTWCREMVLIHRCKFQGKSWLPLPLLHQFVLFLPVCAKFLRHVNIIMLLKIGMGKDLRLVKEI